VESSACAASSTTTACIARDVHDASISQVRLHNARYDDLVLGVTRFDQLLVDFSVSGGCPRTPALRAQYEALAVETKCRKQDDFIAGLDIAQDRGHFQRAGAGVGEQRLRQRACPRTSYGTAWYKAVAGEVALSHGIGNQRQFAR